MVASWDLTAATRDQCARRALQMKTEGKVGDFFIRSKPKSGPKGSYGLTVRIEDRGRKPSLGNFLVEGKNGVFQVRGGDTPFATLDDLVTYYSFQPRIPVGVQLNNDDLYDDGLGLGLDDDPNDDNNETYGLIDELPPSNQHSPLAPLSPDPHLNQSRAPAAVPSQDLAHVSKIELLRKQAEVLAAKRKAAELNVQLLSDHGSGGGGGGHTGHAVRADHGALARQEMEREMAEMKNRGLLAGWYKQLEDIDKIRVNTRATANQQLGGDPPRTEYVVFMVIVQAAIHHILGM